VQQISDIPFLPISFFKSHEVKSVKGKFQKVFHSSGTTGQKVSKHYVYDETIYQLSFLHCFDQFYGNPEDFIILGLLPSYLENDHSSLIYMVDNLVSLSKDEDSGFFINDYEKMLQIIENRKNEKRILIIGVSYALLDLGKKYGPDLSDCIVIETGGMKGKRKELSKQELHEQLKTDFNLEQIHSEYGMTELLSQAYSLFNQRFQCPNWMKILIREYNDPFTLVSHKTGGINAIDLANIYSCSFIATEDLGKVYKDGFEVLGRIDNSDIRGCNLLIQ
jgi:phenylacetate-coenzyme A ligase PaaK-like adenylate-forming protein